MNEIDLLKPFMETFEIITQVEGFYNSAWEKLIILITIGWAIVGILVPVLISYWQKKELKLKEEKLEVKIKDEVSKAKEELDKYFSEEIKKQKLIFEQENIKLRALADWWILHLQANNLISSNAPKTEILASLIRGSLNYLIGENFKNLRKTLRMITQNLNGVSQEEFDKLKNDYEADIIELLNMLKEKNEKWIFWEIIIEIQDKYNRLPRTR